MSRPELDPPAEGDPPEKADSAAQPDPTAQSDPVEDPRRGAPPAGPSGAEDPGGDAQRVPVPDLVDLERLAAAKGRPPTRAELRAALPRGWVLEEDGLHARRDLRLLFREGWILVLGMVCFGGVVLAIFWQAFPRGWRGLVTFLALVAAVLIAGGLVAPLITRALYRRRP